MFDASHGSLFFFLILALGFAAGFWVAMRTARKTEAHQRVRMPRQWPLAPRTVFNARELLAWRWLNQVFGDTHAVFVKLPVTRFTLPRSPNERGQWHDMLNAVYCTFTVCDGTGKVVGCVDVPGEMGISRTNRRIKQSLLSQCGVPYWVLDTAQMPTPHAIRADFLGELETVLAPPALSGDGLRIEEARTQLHELLDRRRLARGADSDLAPLTGPSDWLHQAEVRHSDSFLTSLADESGAAAGSASSSAQGTPGAMAQRAA